MAGIPGKKIVPLLYGSALLLGLGLLWYGKQHAAGTPGKDGVPTIETRDLLRALPREWTRITPIEGQGWVVFVPCGGGPGRLVLETEGPRPSLQCTFCDSLATASILGRASEGLAGKRDPLKHRLDIDAGAGLEVETVTPALAERFAGAPLKDYLLTWKLSGNKAMYFVPTLHEELFETLKAEDESPEGCLTEGAD